MRALRFFTLVLLLPLAFGGCDQADNNIFSFDVNSIRFTFSFDGTQVNGGGAQIAALDNEDILDSIQQQGFSPAEVTSVRLKEGSAQVRILNAPARTDIDFLDAVSLRLTSGVSSTEVASQDDFGSMTGTMSGEADLDVTSADISDTVTGGPFGATLDVDAARAQDGETYRLETRFDVTVQVETL